jgi:hypothetical protein
MTILHKNTTRMQDLASLFSKFLWEVPQHRNKGKTHIQRWIQELKLAGGETVSEAGGLGAALRPQVGPGQSPGGGPGGKAPGRSRVLEIL